MNDYTAAGVNIAEGNRAVALMAAAVQSTYTTAVVAGLGSFGGCFDLSKAVSDLGNAMLVASTDGVGTKTLVAAACNDYRTIGADLVNHCINDILVQGARPLFFLDYIAVDHLRAEQVATIVQSLAAACKAVGCALLGGETAEMPGVYRDNTFDLAGTIVGVVDRNAMLPRDVAVGDIILALPADGLHTNGFSLARNIAPALGGYDARPDRLHGLSVGEALLVPHRCYIPEYTTLTAAGVTIHALAHITGGGVVDNLPRILPAGCGAVITRGSWQVPPIFELLVEAGHLTEDVAFHAFNMGLGMLVVVPPDAVRAACMAVPAACIVGEVVAGQGVALH
ncbi:MAG: phosphoribosylformylglycinamidine cyclo-ligase [Chloroflexales bacterium]|nr:phosphoribosylformylglycinamidine cyclo-ligase [Chloroflexales bacterium]